MGLIDNIKSLCQETGVSLPRLEKELGFSKGSMYNWDKSSPSIDKIQKVADYFKKSVDFILYGFERTQFVEAVNEISFLLTPEEFSASTGIDVDVLAPILSGLISEPPSIDIVKRIAQEDIFYGETRLLKLAGYDIDKKEASLPPKKDTLEELVDAFYNTGYEVTICTKEGGLKVSILKFSDIVENIPVKDFRQIAENLLKKNFPVEQGTEDWSEKECEEIEVFKKFLKLRRKMKNTDEG